MKKTIVVTFDLDAPDGLPEPAGEEVAGYRVGGLTKQDPYDPWLLSGPTVYLETPAVVLGVEGSVIQGGASEIPIELVALDYDTDTASDGDGRRFVPQSGQTRMVEAYVGRHDEWHPELGPAIQEAENRLQKRLHGKLSDYDFVERDVVLADQTANGGCRRHGRSRFASGAVHDIKIARRNTPRAPTRATFPVNVSSISSARAAIKRRRQSHTSRDPSP